VENVRGAGGRLPVTTQSGSRDSVTASGVEQQHATIDTPTDRTLHPLPHTHHRAGANNALEVPIGQAASRRRLRHAVCGITLRASMSDAASSATPASSATDGD
jgi:hypothetical protein